MDWRLDLLAVREYPLIDFTSPEMSYIADVGTIRYDRCWDEDARYIMIFAAPIIPWILSIYTWLCNTIIAVIMYANKESVF